MTENANPSEQTNRDTSIAKDASTEPGRSPLGGTGTDRIITIALVNLEHTPSCYEMVLHVARMAENNGFFSSMRSMQAYISTGGTEADPAEPLTLSDMTAFKAMADGGVTGIMLMLDGERTGLHIFEDIAVSHPEHSFDCAMMLPDGTEMFAHYGARLPAAPTWKRA